MLVPNRHGGTDYRYGYAGMEKDNEVKGEGNSYTTYFRQYDPRVGRWLSIDPYADRGPFIAPYAYAFNNPLKYVDTGGDWPTPGQWLDAVQVVLDVAGMVPAVGNIADIANAGISLARGDKVGAALSLAAAIPGAGLAAGGAKLAKKAASIAKPVMKKASQKAVKTAAKEGAAKTVKETANKVVKETTQGASKKAADDIPTFEKKLQEIADEARAAHPEKGPVAGTKSHKVFQEKLDDLGFEDVHTEINFLDGKQIKSNQKGSSRLDVFVGDPKNPASGKVFDLKTGKAKVSKRQINKTNKNLGRTSGDIGTVKPNVDK